MIEVCLNTVALALVAAACILHLNANEHSHCEKLGFAVLFAGCWASIFEWWLPQVEIHAETVISIGLALIAISTQRHRLHRFMESTLGWGQRQGLHHEYVGPERRQPDPPPPFLK